MPIRIPVKKADELNHTPTPMVTPSAPDVLILPTKLESELVKRANYTLYPAKSQNLLPKRVQSLAAIMQIIRERLGTLKT